jgi:hypothetical protein
MIARFPALPMILSHPARVLTLLLLATLAGAGGCCSGLTGLRSGSCLDGSWELVSAKYTLRDGRVLDPEPGLQSLKILSGGHVAYITVRKDGSFVRSSGGEYEVRGSRYIEHIVYASLATLRGKDFVFTWRLDRDLWFHEGSIGTLRIEEVWRRTRPSSRAAFVTHGDDLQSRRREGNEADRAAPSLRHPEPRRREGPQDAHVLAS